MPALPSRPSTTIARRCAASCTDRTLHRFCQAFTPSASANRGQRLRAPTALQRTLFTVVTRRVSAAAQGRYLTRGSIGPSRHPERTFGLGAISQMLQGTRAHHARGVAATLLLHCRSAPHPRRYPRGEQSAMGRCWIGSSRSVARRVGCISIPKRAPRTFWILRYDREVGARRLVWLGAALLQPRGVPGGCGDV